MALIPTQSCPSTTRNGSYLEPIFSFKQHQFSTIIKKNVSTSLPNHGKGTTKKIGQLQACYLPFLVGGEQVSMRKMGCSKIGQLGSKKGKFGLKWRFSKAGNNAFSALSHVHQTSWRSTHARTPPCCCRIQKIEQLDSSSGAEARKETLVLRM